jgi:hypothetical protein
MLNQAQAAGRKTKAPRHRVWGKEHGGRRSKLIDKRIFNQSKTRLGRSRVFLLFSSVGFVKSWIFSFLNSRLRGNDIKTHNID